jgi:hypothetical protein
MAPTDRSEASKTMSQNKSFLLLSCLCQVFCYTDAKWLIKCLQYYISKVSLQVQCLLDLMFTKLQKFSFIGNFVAWIKKKNPLRGLERH